MLLAAIPLRGLEPRQLLMLFGSSLPLLTILALYRLNTNLRIQPSLLDLSSVHVHTISDLEYSLLGFHPHRIVSQLHWPLLDVLAAVPYMLHFGIPIIFPLYLSWAGRAHDVLRFLWLLGWSTWAFNFISFIFPHAPPFLADEISSFGDQQILTNDLYLEGCAFRRLDTMLGLHFFHDFYKGNPAPFGAFPSGHVAWAVVVYVSGGPGGRWFVLYVFFMQWAALYTCHHYLSDTIGAILLVLVNDALVHHTWGYITVVNKFCTEKLINSEVS